jgi:NtrC-family two-component system sensor histidine kinase KinB
MGDIISLRALVEIALPGLLLLLTLCLIGIALLGREVKHLKELNRRKSEFLMMAAHEIRTPLTSMWMSINLIRESKKLGNGEQELLVAAHEEVFRLKTLVNDLLHLGIIESGQMRMNFGDVPLRRLCEKAVAGLKVQADARSAAISIDVPDTLPDVKADADKLILVLINLLSNALRNTAAGDTVFITAEPSGKCVRVSIRDNGGGIPYELQDKVFDGFASLKTDKHGEGTGLGLAICKKIIDRHNGNIWLESVPGKGSTFTFTLSIAER